MAPSLGNDSSEWTVLQLVIQPHDPHPVPLDFVNEAVRKSINGYSAVPPPVHGKNFGIVLEESDCVFNWIPEPERNDLIDGLKWVTALCKSISAWSITSTRYLFPVIPKSLLHFFPRRIGRIGGLFFHLVKLIHEPFRYWMVVLTICCLNTLVGFFLGGQSGSPAVPGVLIRTIFENTNFSNNKKYRKSERRQSWSQATRTLTNERICRSWRKPTMKTLVKSRR